MGCRASVDTVIPPSVDIKPLKDVVQDVAPIRTKVKKVVYMRLENMIRKHERIMLFVKWEVGMIYYSFATDIDKHEKYDPEIGRIFRSYKVGEEVPFVFIPPKRNLYYRVMKIRDLQDEYYRNSQAFIDQEKKMKFVV